MVRPDTCARQPMRRARVFPLFRRFTQRGSKTVSSISISRLVRRVCARDAKWAAPNPRLRVKFSFFPPTARPKRIRSSRRSDLSRVEANLQKVAFCQLGKKNRRLGRYFSSGRTARAPVDTTATRERRVPDREAHRAQIRVAPQRKHPREGAHFDRVRPHAAHAESQPTRFRRMLLLASRVFAATANRRRARAAGATKAARRGASRASLMRAR